MTVPQRSTGSRQFREEIQHTLAARQELGPEMDDQLVASFVQRIETAISTEIARQVGSRSQEAKELRDWRKEMFGIALGCGIPMLIVGAIASQLLGIVVVCLTLVAVSFAMTWRTR